MTARSGFTVSNGATIATTWGNGVRDHIVPIGTTDDVSSEGQLASNTSTNKVVVHDGTSARTLVAYGEWDTWAMVYGQWLGVQQGTGGVTSSGAGSDAYYTMVGRTVHWSMDLVVGGVSGSSAGSPINIGLPVAAKNVWGWRGNGYYYSNTTGLYYPCIVFGNGYAAAASLLSASTDGSSIALGAGVFTGALAINDTIRVGGSYQAAA